MRTAIFITVRTGSTRLPKKALMEIKGRSLIEHLIDRVKLAELPNIIVICTTVNPNDDALVEIARKNGVEYFRGSESDILERHFGAMNEFNLDFVVNVDGDDIFCDPVYIDKVIGRWKKTGADVVKTEGLPFGANSFGYTSATLRKICGLKGNNVTDTGWGMYFLEPGLFKVETIIAEEELKYPDFRMSLDYPEDFKFFKAVFDRLYEPGKIFPLKDIVSLLIKNPEIADINQGVKKAYEKRLAKHAPKKIKK